MRTLAVTPLTDAVRTRKSNVLTLRMPAPAVEVSVEPFDVDMPPQTLSRSEMMVAHTKKVLVVLSIGTVGLMLRQRNNGSNETNEEAKPAQNKAQQYKPVRQIISHHEPSP
jgi:hypothetical protein